MGYFLLNWQTDCNDLNANGTAKTHHFTIKAKDDFCPVPGVMYQTISVRVTPSPSCNTITSLEGAEFQNQIVLYPNPTSGVVILNGLSITGEYNVVIRNIQGQLVQEQQFKNKSNLEIDLKCKAGVYFIQVRNEKGETANLKVVKQ